MDPLALGSLAVSGVAVAIAVLTWLESRKMRQVFEKVAKSLRYVGRARPGSGKESGPAVGTQAAAEERRRLKLDLDREKHEWRKNRDIVKTIAWILERMNDNERS